MPLIRVDTASGMVSEASLGGGEVRILVTHLSSSRWHGFCARDSCPEVLAAVEGAPSPGKPSLPAP